MPPFDFQPPRSPYVGTIADLMQAPAQAQARAEVTKGQAWGGAMEQIGQNIAAIPGQVQKARTEGQAVAARNALANRLKTTPMVKENGLELWDVGAITKGMAADGFGPEGAAAAPHMNAVNDSFRAVRAAQQATLRTSAEALMAGGNHPILFEQMLRQIEANKLYPSETINEWRALAAQDPAKNIPAITGFLAGPQKFDSAAPGSQARSTLTGELKPGTQVPEKPIVPTRATLAVTAAGGADTPAGAKTALDLMNTPNQPPASQKASFRTKGADGVVRNYEGFFVPSNDGKSPGKYFLPDGQEATFGPVEVVPPKPDAPQYEWAKDPASGQVRLMLKGQVAAGNYTKPNEFEITNAMPADYKDAIERAIASTAQGRKSFWGNLVNSQWQKGDIDGLQSTIRQAAIEGENADTQKQVEGRRDAVAELRNIRGLLAGIGDTNIVSGTIEDTVRKLGTSTDPKMVEVGSRISQALFNYRRAMTGVQFSLAESNQYNKLFPNYNNTVPVNLALLDGLLGSMGTADRTFWEQKLGAKGAQLVGAVAPPPPPPPTVPANTRINRTPVAPAAPAAPPPSQVPPGATIRRGR